MPLLAKREVLVVVPPEVFSLLPLLLLQYLQRLLSQLDCRLESFAQVQVRVALVGLVS